MYKFRWTLGYLVLPLVLGPDGNSVRHAFTVFLELLAKLLSVVEICSGAG